MRSPLKKGVPEGQGIDCLEEAEFCRMRNGKCGIDGRTSGIDGMLCATNPYLASLEMASH